MIENVGVAVGISLISHPIPEMLRISGLRSPVLTSGSLALSDCIGNVVIETEILIIWVYPFEFRQYIVPFQCISSLAGYCLPIYFRFTVFLLNDVRYTFSNSKKYNKTNFSVEFLLIIIVPTIKPTVNNQFAVRHLTSLFALLTYSNLLHTCTNILTYLLTNVSQVYMYESELI